MSGGARRMNGRGPATEAATKNPSLILRGSARTRATGASSWGGSSRRRLRNAAPTGPSGGHKHSRTATANDDEPGEQRSPPARTETRKRQEWKDHNGRQEEGRQRRGGWRAAGNTTTRHG